MLLGPVCLSHWLLLASPAPALRAWQTLRGILPTLDSTAPGVPRVREGVLGLEGTPLSRGCSATDWLYDLDSYLPLPDPGFWWSPHLGTTCSHHSAFLQPELGQDNLLASATLYLYRRPWEGRRLSFPGPLPESLLLSLPHPSRFRRDSLGIRPS